MKKLLGETITLEQILAKLGLIPLPDLRETDDFVNERHWQGGKYWIGWRPFHDKNGINEAAQRQWQYVCESFTQKNVTGSNVNRLEGAILGNEPDFDVVASNSNPLDDPIAEAKRERTPDEKLFDAIDDAMVEWWTQNEIHQVFKDLLRAKAAYGKTSVLVYIPDGYLTETEIEETVGEKIVKTKKLVMSETDLTFEKVISRIKVEVIHYSNVIDVKDTNFGTKVSIVRFEKSEDLETQLMVERYGVFYVNTNGQSCFRIVQSNNKSETISCDIGGNNLCLTFGEYERALVTPSVKKLQKAVNHAETGSNYALANINYPETTFINAAPKEDDTVQVNELGQQVKKPSLWKQGLGIVRELRGIPLESINGISLTTPEIHERNGADPEKFSKESEKKARDIDMLMGMGFKHLADSEYASGDSKAKSMDDLDILISDYETTMNTIGTKVFENVIRLGFFFTNQTKKNKDFKVLFRVNMSQGKLTEPDKKGMREECEMGLRSDENYMLTTKVTDNPKQEKQRIAAQPPKELNAPKGNPPTPEPKQITE